MDIKDRFIDDFNHDSNIVFDNMSYLKLVECEYDDSRGTYRTYFDFNYGEKTFTRIKAFYNPLESSFLFLPDARNLDITYYEWRILRNIITVMVGKQYDLFKNSTYDTSLDSR